MAYEFQITVGLPWPELLMRLGSRPVLSLGHTWAIGHEF
jgi:hypothetical protein